MWNCLQWIISIIALFLSIIAISLSIKENFNNIKFSTIKFPTIGPAKKTGWYRTLGRECNPESHKCFIKNNSGSYHYFCSKHKDCNIADENVKGTLIEEPMEWPVRFA